MQHPSPAQVRPRCDMDATGRAHSITHLDDHHDHHGHHGHHGHHHGVCHHGRGLLRAGYPVHRHRRRHWTRRPSSSPWCGAHQASRPRQAPVCIGWETLAARHPHRRRCCRRACGSPSSTRRPVLQPALAVPVPCPSSSCRHGCALSWVSSLHLQRHRWLRWQTLPRQLPQRQAQPQMQARWPRQVLVVGSPPWERGQQPKLGLERLLPQMWRPLFRPSSLRTRAGATNLGVKGFSALSLRHTFCPILLRDHTMYAAKNRQTALERRRKRAFCATVVARTVANQCCPAVFVMIR